MLKRLGAAWNAFIARKDERPYSGYARQSHRDTRSWYAWDRWGVTRNSKIDYERQAGPPWQNPVVTACLGWMADNVGQAEFQVCKVRRDGTETPKYGHPLLKLLDRPNSHYSGRTLMASTIMAYVIDGNAYWVKVRTVGNDVTELWYVPPWRVIPRWPEDGSEFVSHYEIVIDGRHVAFPRENVIHFRDGIDPYNDRLGMGRIKAAYREICTLNEASHYTHTLLRNMGVPGVVFSPGDESTDLGEAAERLKQLTLERTGDGRFEPMILPVGQIKVDTIGFSPEQMSLSTLPLRDEAILASVIGIPPQVCGLPSGDASKTYANQSEAVRSAWSRLKAILEAMALDINQDLLPDFQPEMAFSDRVTWRVRWRYDNVPELREDVAARVDRALRLFGTPAAPGLMTRNEAREIIGAEPLPPHLGDILADGASPLEEYMSEDEPEPLPSDLDQPNDERDDADDDPNASGGESPDGERDDDDDDGDDR